VREKLEQYLIGVITRKKKGFTPFCLRALLLCMSWPYRWIMAARNWLFDRGWLRRYSAPVPVVISIGNIVAGGTGKTPATIMMAKEFCSEISLAVLARGYRSKAEKLPVPTLLSHGEGPKRTADFCGDEPFMIAQELPWTCVIVGKDRRLASDMAAKLGVQLVILDDGMQHRRLARDFEVVVMDASDLFGQGHYLPRGLLREGAGSLARADLIIVNHVSQPALSEALKRKLSRYSQAPIVATTAQVAQIELISAGKSFPTIQDLKVGAFCAIAQPEHFYKTVEGQGAILVERLALADHRPFDSQTLHNFAARCQEQGVQLLLCTEKDRVKLPSFEGLPLPIASVKISLSIVEGEGAWRDFISQVKKQLAQYC
jgi:tetraacyldisaccharide 4'-kinase